MFEELCQPLVQHLRVHPFVGPQELEGMFWATVVASPTVVPYALTCMLHIYSLVLVAVVVAPHAPFARPLVEVTEAMSEVDRVGV